MLTNKQQIVIDSIKEVLTKDNLILNASVNQIKVKEM